MASSIQAKFETLTRKNYASYVKGEISLPCSIKRTPKISLTAAAACDILVNFEISLVVFIPNTPRNGAIS